MPLAVSGVPPARVLIIGHAPAAEAAGYIDGSLRDQCGNFPKFLPFPNFVHFRNSSISKIPCISEISHFQNSVYFQNFVH
jgi:hypothetical protein